MSNYFRFGFTTYTSPSTWKPLALFIASVKPIQDTTREAEKRDPGNEVDTLTSVGFFHSLPSSNSNYVAHLTTSSRITRIARFRFSVCGLHLYRDQYWGKCNKPWTEICLPEAAQNFNLMYTVLMFYKYPRSYFDMQNVKMILFSILSYQNQ